MTPSQLAASTAFALRLDLYEQEERKGHARADGNFRLPLLRGRWTVIWNHHTAGSRQQQDTWRYRTILSITSLKRTHNKKHHRWKLYLNFFSTWRERRCCEFSSAISKEMFYQSVINQNRRQNKTVVPNMSCLSLRHIISMLFYDKQSCRSIILSDVTITKPQTDFWGFFFQQRDEQEKLGKPAQRPRGVAIKIDRMRVKWIQRRVRFIASVFSLIKRTVN